MSTSREETLRSLGLLILRLAVGGMMLTHGVPKFQKLLTTPEQFADPFGVGPEISLALAVFAEVICSGLLIIGALTRLAALPLFITMATAAFIIHGADPFAKKELALLYASGALTLLFTGAGRLSVDGWWAARKAG